MNTRALLVSVVMSSAALCCEALAQEPVSGRTLYQPECVSSLDRMLSQVADRDVPANAAHMVVRYLGDPGTDERVRQIATPVSWNVGVVSGYRPPFPLSRWQRGHRDVGLPAGASAFQLFCSNFGWLINSYQFTHNVPLVGTGAHMVYLVRFEPEVQVWTTHDAALQLEVEARLPWVYHPGSTGVAQLSLFYYLRDTLTGRRFAHVVGLFDSRAWGDGNGDEFVGNDTEVDFASSPLTEVQANGAPVRFVTRAATSASAVNQFGFADARRFSVMITRANLATILETLRRNRPEISTDIGRYRLSVAGVLAEVGPGFPGNDMSFAGSGRDFTVSEVFGIAPSGALATDAKNVVHDARATRSHALRTRAPLSASSSR